MTNEGDVRLKNDVKRDFIKNVSIPIILIASISITIYYISFCENSKITISIIIFLAFSILGANVK